MTPGDEPGGAAEQFDAFAARVQRRLVGSVYAMTADLGTAEECVQEALVRAWQRWDTVGSYDDPEAWVRRVAFNLALNDRRRRSRFPVGGRGRVIPAVVPGPDPDHLTMADALRRLPGPQRTALVLHDAAGVSVREIAAELGVAEGTVKSWLSRGRSAVAARLGVGDPVPPSRPEESSPGVTPIPEEPSHA